MTSAPELTAIQVPVSGPRVEPLLREIGHECSTRYGKDAHAEIARYPDEEFTGPYGGLLLLLLGVVIGTPVYKAAYSGLLKALLDLLPQYAPAGKTVLPPATGGTAAHVLAIDYALRPVLNSMGPAHITPGWFTLDKDIAVGEDGTVAVEPGAAEALAQVTDQFSVALGGRRPTLLAAGRSPAA